MHPDWIHGFPLREMLAMKSDLPVIGTLFLNEFVIQCFIWGGMLFDLAVVPLLLYRRTRFLAYAVCICFPFAEFHTFNIHIFPWFMIFASTIFFEPDWPRRILGGTGQLSLAVSQTGREHECLEPCGLARLLLLFPFGMALSPSPFSR